MEAGQAVGVQGMTGAATGDHLHFEVWIDGGRIEPLGFMADRGIYW